MIMPGGSSGIGGMVTAAGFDGDVTCDVDGAA